MTVRLSTRALIPLWVALLAGTAACSSTDTGIIAHEAVGVSGAETVGSAAGSAAREEKRGGGENESGGLPFEVGPWDASDPNFRFFDPCAEIPAEVFAEAGLGEMEGNFLFEEGRYSNCYFSLSDGGDYFPDTEVTLFSDLISEDRYSSTGLRILSESDQRGVYLVDDGGSCSTSMDTSRGRWGVLVSYSGDGVEKDECKIALSIHNSIIERLDV
ncbi:DUF3558 family protein [Corynebacterium mastitidis]|uniref:DUF3558 family protein n=1 Tax=Corynebacterium mastitidis TaxID=161890 RepID=UPI000A007B09|nr:DUF3558 family protein [Corynebacterium mastitidis]